LSGRDIKVNLNRETKCWYKLKMETEMAFLIAETIAIIAFLYLFFSFFFLLQYNSEIGLCKCGDRSQDRYS